MAELPKTLFHELKLIDDDKLSFRMGAPGPHVLKKAAHLFDSASSDIVKGVVADPFVLQYGPLAGWSPFRQQLADFLSHEYDDHVSWENLVVTNGATDGIRFTITYFLSRGCTVYTEDPTYFLALTLFQQQEMCTVPVPTDSDGMNMEALERLLKTKTSLSGDNGVSKHTHVSPSGLNYDALVYLVPVFNNPCGYSMSAEKCAQLVRLAHQYNLLILCDDVYNLICFDSPVPKRLLSFDRSEDGDFGDHVISNGTFSKLIGPGLRLGWMEMSKKLVARAKDSAVLQSGGGNAVLTSAMVGSIIQSESAFQQYLHELRAEYKLNLDTMCTVLDTSAPQIKYVKPKGGYFIWLTLPAGVDSDNVVTALATRYNITSASGQSASPTGSFRHCIRLCFTYHVVGELKYMTECFCTVVNELTAAS